MLGGGTRRRHGLAGEWVWNSLLLPSGPARTVLSIVVFKNRAKDPDVQRLDGVQSAGILPVGGTKDPAIWGSHGIQCAETHQKWDNLACCGARWELGECGRPGVELSEPPLGLGDFVTKVAAIYTFPIYVPFGFFYVLKLEWKLMSGQQGPLRSVGLREGFRTSSKFLLRPHCLFYIPYSFLIKEFTWEKET